MKFKFIEIGCSIFNTYIDKFGLDVNGLLVEPMPNLFDVVPSSKTVLKENCAITDHDGEVKFYLYDGFNKNSKYDYIKPGDYTWSQGFGWDISSIDLNPNRKLTGETTVKCLTLKSLLEKYNVTEIDHFKVDAEGHDHIILKQLLDLMNDGFKVNMDILFEYNKLSNKKQCTKVFGEIALNHGFLVKRMRTDIILVKNNKI